MSEASSPAPRLSIVVPVYNEEKTLEAIMHRVLETCGGFSELVIVDDGSTDRSLEIARFVAREQDTVLTKKNGGKGSAIQKGFEHVRGRYVLVQDADLEYSPEEVPAMLKRAEEENLPAVFGSRRLREQKQFAHIAYYIGGVLLTWYFNILYGTKLTDQSTCYKLIRRDVLQSLIIRSDDFRVDAEIASLLARRGIGIVEIPISYHPRTAAEGKKISWKDFFGSVWVSLKLRFMPKSTLFRL